jgi:O-antigen ligase
MFKNATLGSAKLFFVISFFVVSFSTALTNIFAGLLLITFLLAVLADRSLLAPLKLTPSVLALLLLAMLLLGWSWSIAPQDEVFHALGKYRKLLLLPIGIALVWRDGALARKAFLAFMAGAAALALATYLVWLDLMPTETFGWWTVGDPNKVFAFKSYITIGILLGFAAVACWGCLPHLASLRARICALLAGIYFAFPVIFLILGRSGYVVVLCGMISLCLLRFRRNRKMLAASMLAVAIAVVLVFNLSDNIKMRSEQLETEVQSYSHTTELNSTRIRLSFYRAGIQMFLHHPVLGTGTGSFAEGFAPTAMTLAPVGDPFRTERSQPHSEIVLMGVQLGSIGLLLYFGLLGSLALVVRHHKSYQADLLLLLCVSFAVPAAFNSLLWDFTEGHWFVLLAGCLYAAACRPDAPDLIRKRASA